MNTRKYIRIFMFCIVMFTLGTFVVQYLLSDWDQATHDLKLAKTLINCNFIILFILLDYLTELTDRVENISKRLTDKEEENK